MKIFGRKAARIARVAATGVAGTGTVTAIEVTGVLVNDNPRCRVRFNIAIALRIQADDGRPPYDLRLGTGYPPGLGRPRKGDRLAVRIDADDPRQVAFDWAGSSPRKERAR